jgi:hypothetical protein
VQLQERYRQRVQQRRQSVRLTSQVGAPPTPPPATTRQQAQLRIALARDGSPTPTSMLVSMLMLVSMSTVQQQH